LLWLLVVSLLDLMEEKEDEERIEGSREQLIAEELEKTEYLYRGRRRH
jgi:hypothetical protein